jgi:AraC-like DNA-binding protein
VLASRFSTDDLPAKDRWSTWYDIATDAHIPNLVRTEHRETFQGSVCLLDLGAVQVSTLTYSPLEVFRTEKFVRRADPGLYQLIVPLRGEFGVAQAGRECRPGTRDLVLYDTSQPYYGRADAPPGEVACSVVVLAPKQLVPLAPKTFDPFYAVTVPGGHGMGALLSRHLIELTRHAPSYTTGDAARLATITLDLIAATYAHELDATRTLPAETHRQALQTRISDFIQRRLGDPGLGPGMIAEAHAISTRYLHRLFQERGETVAGWIRQRRLDRCRRDLADPLQHHRPVHAIARTWGFSSNAHFSRLFRAAYGMTPGEFRALAALDGQGPPVC